MQVEVTGIAWYRAEDYDRLRAMFKDPEHLQDSFEEWLSEAHRVWKELTKDGLRLEKAYLDPDTFPDWCRANGMEMNADGRARYAAEYVAKNF